jgi:hypothetical protein
MKKITRMGGLLMFDRVRREAGMAKNVSFLGDSGCVAEDSSRVYMEMVLFPRHE